MQSFQINKVIRAIVTQTSSFARNFFIRIIKVYSRHSLASVMELFAKIADKNLQLFSKFLTVS